MKKVITHNGPFHADEKAARAILIVLGVITEETLFERRDLRTGVTPEELADPETMILDMGRQFNPELNNFDHHQDAKIPATNMLVLDHFCKDEAIKEWMKKLLFDYIDQVDRGQIVEGTESIPTFSGMIRNLNMLEGGSEIADQVSLQIIRGTTKRQRSLPFQKNGGRVKLKYSNLIQRGWSMD